MGKLVTFWSPYEGKAKVTSSMCAIAAQFGMNYPELSIAITHSEPDDYSLEEKTDIRDGTIKEKMELYKRLGLSALKINYRQATLTSEKIRRSAINLRMKSLFLYPNAECEKDELSFLLLSETLKDEFDLVFLDLESGRQEDTFKYLSVSDMLVIVLPQDPAAWERFCFDEINCDGERKSCILLGGYISAHKYGSRFFNKNADGWKKRAMCGVVPVNGGFYDAMTEGRVFDFFYRNQFVQSKEENYEFIVQTKKAAENIRKKLFV